MTGINIWIVIGINGITSPAWDTNWNIPSSVIKHGWCWNPQTRCRLVGNRSITGEFSIAIFDYQRFNMGVYQLVYFYWFNSSSSNIYGLPANGYLWKTTIGACPNKHQVNFQSTSQPWLFCPPIPRQTLDPLRKCCATSCHRRAYFRVPRVTLTTVGLTFNFFGLCSHLCGFTDWMGMHIQGKEWDPGFVVSVDYTCQTGVSWRNPSLWEDICSRTARILIQTVRLFSFFVTDGKLHMVFCR